MGSSDVGVPNESDYGARARVSARIDGCGDRVVPLGLLVSYWHASTFLRGWVCDGRGFAGFWSLATFYEELESQFVGREPESRSPRERGIRSYKI